MQGVPRLYEDLRKNSAVVWMIFISVV
jgi:hypothetical protein